MDAIPESPFDGPCTHCGASIAADTKARVSLRIQDGVSRIAERLCSACVDQLEPSGGDTARTGCRDRAGRERT